MPLDAGFLTTGRLRKRQLVVRALWALRALFRDILIRRNFTAQNDGRKVYLNSVGDEVWGRVA